MVRRCASATLVLVLAGLAEAASGTDSLTGLPVPDEAGMQLGTPMKLDPAQVCKSTMTSDFYSPSGFKVSAALAWYGAHLKGFKHVHGYGAGRTQDAFFNADGTLMVGVTGSPAADGTDTEVYGVSYSTMKPGGSEKMLKELLSQNINCSG